jgi:hypothetical protein
MDVFRFVKLQRRANDPTRRYVVVYGEQRENVGDLEIGGDVPDGEFLTLTLTCRATLSDAAREDALNTARRFLDELGAGWGHLLAEVRREENWVELPDGTFRMRVEYQVVCANP